MEKIIYTITATGEDETLRVNIKALSITHARKIFESQYSCNGFYKIDKIGF